MTCSLVVILKRMAAKVRGNIDYFNEKQNIECRKNQFKVSNSIYINLKQEYLNQ